MLLGGSEMCSAAENQVLEQDVYHLQSLWFNSGLSCKYVTVSLGKPRTAFEEQVSTLLGSSSTSGIYVRENMRRCKVICTAVTVKAL